jgi:hypothetical protein
MSLPRMNQRSIHQALIQHQVLISYLHHWQTLVCVSSGWLKLCVHFSRIKVNIHVYVSTCAQ